jgi:hypothetical protein
MQERTPGNAQEGGKRGLLEGSTGPLTNTMKVYDELITFAKVVEQMIATP